MKFENTSPWQDASFRPASEQEVSVPERLRQLHEVEGHFLSRGVFFDVYAIDLPDEKGRPEPFVFKDFRSGDAAMTPEEQVALFQHQYYEFEALKKRVGKKFFPESYWVRSTEFSDDEAHGFYSVPGKTANTMQQFMSTQLDRQLMNRYSSDDKRKGALKNLLAKIGESLLPKHEKKPFIGAVVQEKVEGVTFAEALKRVDRTSPAFEKLKNNAAELIRGLRQYHNENQYGAFTWHGLESDNVMVEVNKEGSPTGKVYIVDANFTERPNTAFRDMVVGKLEKEVFEKLERELEIG
ncbi:hypothetical protein HY633_04005 [Candidatus Uhrbacteria bacterium]|nr:hypothetical protein [Candidatus Uhrbacteria bacterium]